MATESLHGIVNSLRPCSSDRYAPVVLERPSHFAGPSDEENPCDGFLTPALPLSSEIILHCAQGNVRYHITIT